MVTLGNLLGTAIGMVASPILVESMSISRMQLIYGVVAAASAVLFVVFAREHPPTPACDPDQEERALVLDGLAHALKVGAFWAVLAISFVGLGVFNGLTTWVEAMIRPRGFTPGDAGTLGAVLLLGGLVGAVVLPALSDRRRSRGPFLALAFLGAIPGLKVTVTQTSITGSAQTPIQTYCSALNVNKRTNPPETETSPAQASASKSANTAAAAEGSARFAVLRIQLGTPPSRIVPADTSATQMSRFRIAKGSKSIRASSSFRKVLYHT